ncbi:MAG: Ig-like domain-containing protein [Paludibacteraceae bacterium]
MKKFNFLMLLPLLAMVVFFSCKEEGSVKIESSISLEQKEVVLNPGGTATLTATLIQAIDGSRVRTGDDATLTWTSTNDSIATVSYGVVTAVTGGEVDIIVSTTNVDNVPEQRCRVVVRDIYVAGEYGDNTTRTACVWKNNKVFYNLASGANAFANAMVVTDNKDVYVAGNVNNVGKVWKNGAELYTGLGTELKSLVVDGSDVYVAGADANTSEAKVWKNGTAELSVAGATFNALAVNGGTIYVGGKLDNKATIWKGDAATPLVEATSVVNGLCINGADVYAAGVETNAGGSAVGKVWKSNQELYAFDNNTTATEVLFADNKLYTCGYQENSSSSIKAKLWIDGVQKTASELDKEYLGEFVVGKNELKKELYTYTDLSSAGIVEAHSIYISLDDIYVAGYFNSSNMTTAVYWKNGEPQSLEKNNISEIIWNSSFTPGTNRTRATAIVVK